MAEMQNKAKNILKILGTDVFKVLTTNYKMFGTKIPLKKEKIETKSIPHCIEVPISTEDIHSFLFVPLKGSNFYSFKIELQLLFCKLENSSVLYSLFSFLFDVFHVLYSVCSILVWFGLV